MQLGQLQMSKKLLKCLKKRKERSELYLLNVYVFYARGCKSTLAVTPTLHCWSKKKEKYREKNETFSAAGSARTMGLVSGAGMAQLHRVAHASVTAQLLQTRAVVQWSQSRATACRGWKRSPVLSPPPGTTPGWENFLLADWHRLKRQCSQDLWPSTACLLTATFLTQQPKRCWAVLPGSPGQKCSPHPSKETLCVFPCTQSWQPSFSMARHQKTSCLPRNIHKKLFHVIFVFIRIWAWGSQNAPIKVSGLAP